VLDRIELRRQETGAGDDRVVVDFRGGIARVDVTLAGKRTKHEIDATRFAPIVDQLTAATPHAIAVHAPGGAPVGHELILSAGMTQTVYRWVATAPATWEPIATAANAVLEIARALSNTG